jgi:hypothetical protein
MHLPQVIIREYSVFGKPGDLAEQADNPVSNSYKYTYIFTEGSSNR